MLLPTLLALQASTLPIDTVAVVAPASLRPALEATVLPGPADTARLRQLAQLTPVAGFPLQEAFHVALRLEDTLIESQIFVVYDGDPPEVIAAVDTLREQTEKHQRRLSEQTLALGG